MHSDNIEATRKCLEKRMTLFYMQDFTYSDMSASTYAVSRVGAMAKMTAALLDRLTRPAAASVTSENDPGHPATRTARRRRHAQRLCRSARAAARRKLPAALVIHENRGLNRHIEDVARRVARAGFFAVAPNFLSGQGGTSCSGSSTSPHRWRVHCGDGLGMPTARRPPSTGYRAPVMKLAAGDTRNAMTLATSCG